MNITALIPARGGSVRIPKKNIVDLGGSTLLEWTIGAAHVPPRINKIAVSSDDDTILNLANDTGVETVRRPDEYAADSATDYDVVSHYLKELDTMPDLIVYLRPTTPLRRIAWIDEAIEMVTNLNSVTGLRSVHEMAESAFKCFKLTDTGQLTMLDGNEWVDKANLPNHLYETTYHPNGAIDIIRPSEVLKHNLYGSNCIAYLTPWTIEIDTPADLEYARFLVGRRENASI
jgi:CMP-N,N'-diacetyllegionaminic acid synthase